ncbi:expressed unknown protein [Seminavis robusta]|nr:expressed unknown protein [Seminavis robusta]|eukprot:Sro2630_g333150.1 n/a (128) ;mRNA; r:12417-12800
MEPATEADLKAATRQGTILAIRVDGKRYGHGWVDGGWFQKVPGWVKALFGILGWMVVVTSLTLFWKYVIPVISGLFGSFMDMVFPVWWRRKLPSAFKEHFHIEAEVKPEPEEDGFLKRKKPVSYVYT